MSRAQITEVAPAQPAPPSPSVPSPVPPVPEVLPESFTGSGQGWVALVGGGPGSNDLITARGLELLGQADVVVVDALAPRGLLKDLHPDTEVIDASKRRGEHVMSQAQIDALLVDMARRGKGVVRLKGGDPYVLGRGGEEAVACQRAGVAVEVVPGITSAVSVPAAAGIPITHRGLSRGFSVITAHADLGVLPQRRDHTLILLMGVSRLRDSVTSLLEAGSDPATPAAVIERGYRPDQRVTTTELRCLADIAARYGVTAPAVIVIGDVVTLSPYWADRVVEETRPASPAA